MKYMTQLPNILSVFRLILALLLPFTAPHLWLPILVFAAFTEWADGYLARKLNVESEFGRMIDPVADKLLFISVLLTMLLAGSIQIWQILMLSIRELTVLSGLVWMAIKGEIQDYKSLTPKWSGKLATAAQYLFFISVIYLMRVDRSLLLLATLAGIWSGWDYMIWFLDKRKSIKKA
jgi:CDP-diacylglycerol--glycerol-3-phosphate 3-phosphatidyltransferase